MSNSENKKTITIYHLHFEDLPRNKEQRDKDYYFGSISAIYEVFTEIKIGIKASSLYNFKLDKDSNPIYKNKWCWIRKDVLISKTQSK